MSTTGVAASRILKLDEAVVNRIAAGEVVQRPSAAIKEMLENCLDAGATSVIVTIKGGGMQLMQIQDNGHGIHRDDLAVVCERFTTSKLTSFEDLKTISTFGFRGEALASITHVAHVTITSRTADSPCAYKAKYSDGKLVSSKPGVGVGGKADAAAPVPCAGTVGTTITVEDLFYNMSTRKLAFKNLNEQYQRVLDVVTRYSIHFASRKEAEEEDGEAKRAGQEERRGKGGVSFTCKKHGSALADLHTTAAANTDEAIKIAYGAAVARELLKISFQSTGDADSGTTSSLSRDADRFSFTVRGRISNANYNTKRGVFILFINNRLVESPAIKRTAEALYEDLLPKHTHPFVYLSIDMPAHHVDVNVHPTKKEVHFLYETELLRALHGRIGELLVGANASRTFYTPALQTGGFEPDAEVEEAAAVAAGAAEDDNDNDADVGEERRDAYVAGVAALAHEEERRPSERGIDMEGARRETPQGRGRGDEEDEQQTSKRARGSASSSSSSASSLVSNKKNGDEEEEEQWDEDVAPPPAKPRGMLQSRSADLPEQRRSRQLAEGGRSDSDSETPSPVAHARLETVSYSDRGGGKGRGEDRSRGRNNDSMEGISDSDEASDDVRAAPAADATHRMRAAGPRGDDGASAGKLVLRPELRAASAAAAPRAKATAAPYNPSRLVRVDAAQVRIDSVFRAASDQPSSSSSSSTSAVAGSNLPWDRERGRNQEKEAGQRSHAADVETDSDDGSGGQAEFGGGGEGGRDDLAAVLMCGSCGDVPTYAQAVLLDAAHSSSSSSDAGPASASAGGAGGAGGGGGSALLPSDCACCGQAGTLSLRQAQQQRRRQRQRRDVSAAEGTDRADADADADADAESGYADDMPTPSFVFQETAVDYDSIRALLQDIQTQKHASLQQALSQYSLVGVVDARWTAVQSGTRLLLLNHCRIARLLCYQLALRRFGVLPAVPLQTPVSVRACIRAALQCPEAQWSPSDGSQWDIASRVAARLLEKGPMLQEYFSLSFAAGMGAGSEVNTDGRAGAEVEGDGEGDVLLMTIPEILPAYRPQPQHLGMFLLRLATDTPWEQEKECFQGVAAQLADFYSRLCPDADTDTYTDAGDGTRGADGGDKSAADDASSMQGPSKELQNTVARLVLPAMRACLAVPAACATDGTVVQAAALEQLYKIFERC
jgi:DNA mismatch repair protein MutL